jgi:hypothetical protein
MNSLPPFAAPPASVAFNADSDLDECEVLLKRAIAMVIGPMTGSRSTDGSAETPTELVRSALVHPAPPSEVDECEALLRHAIEIVRGRKGGCQPEQKTRNDSNNSVPVHPAPPKSASAAEAGMSHLDDCEVIVNRTIEVIRRMACGEQTGSPSEVAEGSSVFIREQS